MHSIPTLSFRSIIEVLLPGDLGVTIANYLLWPIPFWYIPAIVAVPLFGLLVAFFRFNRTACIVTCVVLYVANFYSAANTQYHNNYFWDDYDDRTGDGLTNGMLNESMYLMGRASAKAEAGEITWEEYYWEARMIRQAQKLATDHVMSGFAFTNHYQEIREYLDSREERWNDFKGLQQGGFMDRVHYRMAVDKLNSEPGPFQSYVEVRDKEQDGLRDRILMPVIAGLAAFFAFGLVWKYLHRGADAIRKATGQRSFAEKLASFTHAQTLTETCPVKGPIRLDFPKLYVGDTPFQLDGGWIDSEHLNLLHLKSGTRLYLYADDLPVYRHEDAPKPKRKFTWDYFSPKPPEPRAAKDRRSIFDRTH